MAATSSFKLFVFTQPGTVSGETSILNELFHLGAEGIYFRKEQYSQRALDELFIGIDPHYHSRILIPVEASRMTAPLQEYTLHVREKEKGGFDVSSVAPGRTISTSLHDIEAWPNIDKHFSYCFYSPLFPGISKPGHNPSLSLPHLATRIQLLRNTRSPRLIALGGIEESNINEVDDAGFDGAAMLGAIWKAIDPVKAFADIRSKIL